MLFDRTLGVRDKGDLTIGSIMIIVNALPVDDYISGIPVIKSEEQSIICKSECHFIVTFN